MQRSYEQINKAVQKLGYRFFTGDGNLNIIGERTSNNFTNKFDDFLHFVYEDETGPKVLTIPATTKAGLYGGNAALNPKGEGEAVLIPNQYRSSHKFLDWNDVKALGHSTKPWDTPFFQQIAPLRVWRDGNKDTIIDHVNINEGIFGINIHVMSQDGVEGKLVNNWSEGCSGAEQPEWEKVIPIAEYCSRKKGPIYSYTLMETKDFE